MQDFSQIAEKLKTRQAELESRIEAIHADITHQNQPLSADWSEQAVERENEEVLEALGNASQNELRQIKRALQRIDNNNYQVCVSCACTIPMPRLELVPYTVYCTACAEKHENK